MKVTPKRSALGEPADLPEGRGNGQIKKAGRKKVKPIGRRSRPVTPLMRWKFEDKEKGKQQQQKEEEEVTAEIEKKCTRRAVKKDVVIVSARKLAAGLWKLQPDAVVGRENQRSSRAGGFDELGFQIEPSFQISNTDIEGATKWDPICSKKLEDTSQMFNYMKPREQQISAVAVVSALELKLEQARARIQELEHEQKSSKKKLESFLRKISEEKAAWRTREHEKIRAVIDDAKSDLNRERKYRQRVEVVNSKLVNELDEAKLSAKRYMQEGEKERKARELIEEVCEELAKEIGDDKEVAEAIKMECLKIREDVEDERKMLQMAEVWREERVQMKLVDIKVAVEEKYSLMNRLAANLENFLHSKGATLDSREIGEAEMLQQAAASIKIKDVRDFSYDPYKVEDIFAVLEDGNMAEMNEKDIEACVYSPASASKARAPGSQMESKRRQSNGLVSNDGDLEGEESGWETVSQLEDHGSSYSPDGSVQLVNKGCINSTASGGVTEWEDKVGHVPNITEITEVSTPKQSKRGSSISRLWKQHNHNGEDNFKVISVEGVSDTHSDGRHSNGSIHSLDQGSVKGVHSPSYMIGWSSPDSRNPNYHKGMKGCIEWPRAVVKNSLKAKLMAARIESQKVQLRQVLKQKY